VNTATYCPSVSLSWSTVHWCYRETGPLTTCLTHTRASARAAQSVSCAPERLEEQTQRLQHLDTHHERARVLLMTRQWVYIAIYIYINIYEFKYGLSCIQCETFCLRARLIREFRRRTSHRAFTVCVCVCV